MFRMYANNSHSYTPLIIALGIVRKPTVWGFITSEYPGTHDIGRTIDRWGRLSEVPSEDPYHAGTYAASFVRGMQVLALAFTSPSTVRNHKD